MSGATLAAAGHPLMVSENPTGAALVCWANEPDRLEAGPLGLDATGWKPVPPVAPASSRWRFVGGWSKGDRKALLSGLGGAPDAHLHDSANA